MSPETTMFFRNERCRHLSENGIQKPRVNLGIIIIGLQNKVSSLIFNAGWSECSSAALLLHTANFCLGVFTAHKRKQTQSYFCKDFCHSYA